VKRIAVIVASVTAMIVVATYLVGLQHGFANGDEVFYGEFIRGIHRSGDWFTLSYQGVAILQRPALPISLSAAVAWFVPGELGMRLLPAIVGALVAVGAGAVVWRETRDLFAAAAATAFIAAIPTMHCYTRFVSADPFLAAAVLGATAATIRAQDDPRAVFWVGAAAGLAVAFKSFGAGIPLLALFPWVVRAVLYHGLAAVRPIRSVVIFLVLAVPFYAFSYARHGQRFLDEHFGYNLVARARGYQGIGYEDGALSYVGHFLRVDGMVVSAILGLTMVVGVFVVVRWRALALALVLSTAVVVLVGLSIIATRLPAYLVPLYPLFGIAAGLLLARLPRGGAALPALAALYLLWRSSAEPPLTPDQLPATETMFLARILGSVDRGATRIYSLDWYAPALGYYADLPYTYLSTSQRAYDIIHGVDLFAVTRSVQLVPPWPAESFYLAGERARLDDARARWPERFVGAERFGSAEGYELWKLPAI
jgi:4-amino-4-deoxy-L-arabinose transferase-like glycosyltransferase